MIGIRYVVIFTAPWTAEIVVRRVFGCGAIVIPCAAQRLISSLGNDDELVTMPFTAAQTLLRIPLVQSAPGGLMIP